MKFEVCDWLAKRTLRPVLCLLRLADRDVPVPVSGISASKRAEFFLKPEVCPNSLALRQVGRPLNEKFCPLRIANALQSHRNVPISQSEQAGDRSKLVQRHMEDIGKLFQYIRKEFIMIFIIGGRYQGKCAFAAEMTGQGEAGFEQCDDRSVFYRPADPMAANGDIFDIAAAADGRTDEFEKAFHVPLVLHLEGFVRRVLEKDGDPILFLEQLFKENNRAVVIADEIGSGVVPIDPFEREYRENAGRVSQKAAALSAQVYRVVCGIGIRLK